MDTATLLLAFVLSSVAIAAPFGLRFDDGGLAGMPVSGRGRRVLFAVMALLFGFGFVALAAAGAGAVLGIDGVAAMAPLASIWCPLLLLATRAAARRDFGRDSA